MSVKMRRWRTQVKTIHQCSKALTFGLEACTCCGLASTGQGTTSAFLLCGRSCASKQTRIETYMVDDVQVLDLTLQSCPPSVSFGRVLVHQFDGHVPARVEVQSLVNCGKGSGPEGLPFKPHPPHSWLLPPD